MVAPRSQEADTRSALPNLLGALRKKQHLARLASDGNHVLSAAARA
jgi:hypothetical protein